MTQNSYSTKQLLSNKSESAPQTFLQNNTSFFKKDKQGMPLIEEYSFRTETDEFDARRQEYLFRMNFNGKESRNVQDKITKHNIQLYELKSQILEEDQLIRRYAFITDWFYADQELAWFANKKQILEDKRTIYKKMMRNSLEFDLNDLLKTEESLHELDQDALQLEHEKAFAIQLLLPDKAASSDIALQSNNWISLETMQQVLAKFTTSQIPNLEQAIQQKEIDFANLELEREVAEGNKVLDFVQAKYAGRNNISFQREFSLGLSLIIPTKSSNRIKRNEALLEILDEQFEQELLKQEIKEDLTEAYAQFDLLLKEYDLVQNHIENSQLNATYDTYKKNGSVHPLTLLRIKESILKNQRTLQKIEKEACLLFLEILAIKGLLSRTPSINYLSDNLDFF